MADVEKAEFQLLEEEVEVMILSARVKIFLEWILPGEVYDTRSILARSYQSKALTLNLRGRRFSTSFTIQLRKSFLEGVSIGPTTSSVSRSIPSHLRAFYVSTRQ